MGLSIQHFTEEHRRIFKEAHDLAEPKEWAVMDGTLVYGFYDTKEEAEAEIKEVARDDQIQQRFSDWEDDIADEFGIDLEVVREIVKARIH
jgi:TRAP-type C4-dicarboxylate transport system substrate-binding protein